MGRVVPAIAPLPGGPDVAQLSQAARLDQFARALAADTGLSYDAAHAWAQAEVGPLNNLGIMQGSTPASYATPAQGAAAAAQLINSSPYYAGIRASTKGTTAQQLVAIAQSPWRLGPTGLKRAGGTDPYYARVFGLDSATITAASQTTVPAQVDTTRLQVPAQISVGSTTPQAVEQPIAVPAYQPYPVFVPMILGGGAQGIQTGGGATATGPALPASSVAPGASAGAPGAPVDSLGLAILAGGAILAIFLLRSPAQEA